VRLNGSGHTVNVDRGSAMRMHTARENGRLAKRVQVAKLKLLAAMVEAGWSPSSTAWRLDELISELCPCAVGRPGYVCGCGGLPPAGNGAVEELVDAF